jgi:hypothetical protein
MLNKFSTFTLQARNNDIFNMVMQEIVIWVPAIQQLYERAFNQLKKQKIKTKTLALTRRINQWTALLLIALLALFQQFHYQWSATQK